MINFNRLRDRITSYKSNKTTPETIKEINKNSKIVDLQGREINIENILTNKNNSFTIKAINGIEMSFLTNEEDVLKSKEFIPDHLKNDIAEGLKTSPYILILSPDGHFMMHLDNKNYFLSNNKGNLIKDTKLYPSLDPILTWASHYNESMFRNLNLSSRNQEMSEIVFYKHLVPIADIATDHINENMSKSAVKDGEKLADVPLECRTYDVCIEAMKAINRHPERMDNVDYIPLEYLDYRMLTTGMSNGLTLDKIMPTMRYKSILDFAVRVDENALSLLDEDERTSERIEAAVRHKSKAFEHLKDHEKTSSLQEHADVTELIEGIMENKEKFEYVKRNAGELTPKLETWQNNNAVINHFAKNFDNHVNKFIFPIPEDRMQLKI